MYLHFQSISSDTRKIIFLSKWKNSVPFDLAVIPTPLQIGHHTTIMLPFVFKNKMLFTSNLFIIMFIISQPSLILWTWNFLTIPVKLAIIPASLHSDFTPTTHSHTTMLSVSLKEKWTNIFILNKQIILFKGTDVVVQWEDYFLTT